MSKSKKVNFISNHPQMTIMRKPIETTRSVNGVMQIVKEDQPPFKFDNGNLQVTEEEAEEIRGMRGYGNMYEELPDAVEKVAEKNKDSDSDKTGDEDSKVETDDTGNEEPEENKETEEKIEPTVVEGVESFNEASNYLKNEWGLDHSEVNSKDKVATEAAKLGIEFPNYDQD